MSRRSLRLDDSLLDRVLPRSSASFSVGGASWRSSRSLKCRRSQQHSLSCSESLLQTPHKPAGPSLYNSSLHSAASDASLLSSLLDESSIQESTLVDTFWGLDHDSDPKENTITAEQSSVVANSTLIGSDGLCAKHPLHSGAYWEESPAATQGSSSSESRHSETSIIYCRGRKNQTVRSSACRVMSLKESTSSLKELHPNGSLSSALSQLAQSGASALWPLTTKVCSASWSAGCSAGRTAGGGCRWLHRRWCHMTSSFHLTWFPVWLSLLLPLLLLFSLCWFGPAALPSLLPAVNITEWSGTVPNVPSLSSVPSFVSSESQSAEGAAEESLYSERPTGEEAAAAEAVGEEVAVTPDDSERLVRLEQSVTALWERVDAGGRRAEQRHGEVLQLYTDLQQQLSARSDGVEPWLSSLLDRQLSQLRRRLDEDRRQRDEVRDQDRLLQQSQTSRLDHLELQLQTLAAKTQEVQWKQEAAATTSSTLPAAVSSSRVGVDQKSHDALLAEVVRLEAALEGVKRDVEALSGCQDNCRLLTRIHQTVSTQVRREVQALVYGNQLTSAGDAAALPDSLLQWLSQQYVSSADLQAALASLELGILRNISVQLEQQRSKETVREAVVHAVEAAGAAVTQEDVHVMVTNALRLFSQDQTGLADYALESGGGSILSTRCSETYETKAALLSLFGLPLWYFSQSPRAVIQPDVHPGNCWAFKGSTGFLVIRLSMRIVPTAFTLEHIPKTLAPSGKLGSAPRDFSVYGLEDESAESGTLLGSYTYDKDGEALQTYAITEGNHESFQIIEVRVLSNWGHREYTCLYRFRVHGTPAAV